MVTTDYHVKLYAHELLRRCPSGSVERFTAALMDSQVDLNPHQVDAALFAFRSPLSKGAILADEVGLGKTIEAGIVLSQKWAERKHKILIILPSSLRKQWHQELFDKFYLPSQILEAVSFNKAMKKGIENPFDSNEIIICSYQFARNKSDFVKAIDWDLVVIDEAHRLRNVYKNGNKIARELKQVIEHAPKLLLTATPLQNSLLELYGLVSFIDEHTFGDLESFRSQFARLNSDDGFDDLKQRLKRVCKRTLRSQVSEYIRYTERKAYTQEFVPSAEEDALYDMVSEYLQRPNLQALSAGQRSLMILVLRKLLASSTFAIAGALESLANKLKRKLKNDSRGSNQGSELGNDFETFDELADEFNINGEECAASLKLDDRTLIKNEIKELRTFFKLAMKISENAKGKALLHALRIGFKMTTELGGAEKAVIFTESRQTQNYLVTLLARNGYADDIVIFNGSNNDSRSRKIYNAWKKCHEGVERVTESPAVNTRAALVDYFRNSAKIMIATEAAAEGINLQFCSLVVNYDLPWNPQRIEQRIGRCHRYGQKHDVVVINFLNKNNAADQRVHELLSEKFKLFDGVFGASDEVLGSIESGVDFEKRIAEIYQACRDPEEIRASFDRLQRELEAEINENMWSTRQKLLNNFDAEVAEKLNVYKAKATASLNRYEALLWDTTRHMLSAHAEFDEESLTFRLYRLPEKINAATGLYTLKRQDDFRHHYRLLHPLAQAVLHKAASALLPRAALTFQYTGAGKKISIIEKLVGKCGWLAVNRLSVKTLETEDYIICAALTDAGQELEEEQVHRLFNLPAAVNSVSEVKNDQIEAIYLRRKEDILGSISARNANFFEEEMEKLDRWTEDKRKSLKKTLKDYDYKIVELKKQARRAPNFPEKLMIQKRIRNLDKKRDDAWREYDEAVKKIEKQKDTLLDQVEVRLEPDIEEQILFTVRWTLI